MAVLRRILRRLLRVPVRAPKRAHVLVPSDDAPEWLMRVRPDGVKEHFPASSGRVQLGPAVDPLAPVGHLHQRPPLTPSQVLRQAARQRRHDGTWGR
jgi:hypothetical protein